MTTMHDIEIPTLASRLLDAGIPVIVCTPNPNWKPGTQVADVLPAKGWATITAAQARERIGDFRPGIDTLAMVGGHGIDVLDVDTKNDGVSFNDLPVEARDYGITLSPSGGAHFPVPSTGYGKGALNVSGKHIGDYIGGTAAGGGRMLAFLPGSARPKYAGRDYVESKPWDIDRLLDDSPPDIILTICENSGNLSKTASEGKHAATTHEILAFRGEHADAVACAYGDAELARILSSAPATKRHEWFIASITRITELIKAGCLDVSAIDALEQKLRIIKPEGGTSAMGCLAWALGNTTAMSECPTHDPSTIWLNEAASKPTPTEDRVFAATPELSWLRDFARARMVSPWALLAACTARVLACTGPAWQIPAYVGSQASLNFYVALIGSSNSGKTITSSVAAEALPSAGVEIVNPSSGEGLVAIFHARERGQDIEVRDRALSVIDEIKTLGGQQDRSGSTLGSILRSAWSGTDISNHSADPARRRAIGAHTYRYCMVAGVQYDTADVLMRDDGAGTPQRFLWIPAADPAAALDHPEPPKDGPLARWEAPKFLPGSKFVIGYPDGVRDLVRRTRLEAVRNTDSDRDSLHGHMLLVRMKLAAGLAILHGTTNVSDVLWEASGHVIDLSTATLDIVLEHARKKAAKEATAKGHAAAIADEVKEERKLVQVARRIGSYVARNSRDGDGPTRTPIQLALGRDKALVNGGIAKAIDLGYVEERQKPHARKLGITTCFYVPGKVKP